MKIKEIRLETVKIYRDDSEIYSGKVENASDEIKNSDIKTIHFENSILIINI